MKFLRISAVETIDNKEINRPHVWSTYMLKMNAVYSYHFSILFVPPSHYCISYNVNKSPESAFLCIIEDLKCIQ